MQKLKTILGVILMLAGIGISILVFGERLFMYPHLTETEALIKFFPHYGLSFASMVIGLVLLTWQ